MLLGKIMGNSLIRLIYTDRMVGRVLIKVFTVSVLCIISSFAGCILTMICVVCKENGEQEISDKEQEKFILKYNNMHNPE